MRKDIHFGDCSTEAGTEGHVTWAVKTLVLIRRVKTTPGCFVDFLKKKKSLKKWSCSTAEWKTLQQWPQGNKSIQSPRVQDDIGTWLLSQQWCFKDLLVPDAENHFICLPRRHVLCSEQPEANKWEEAGTRCPFFLNYSHELPYQCNQKT